MLYNIVWKALLFSAVSLLFRFVEELIPLIAKHNSFVTAVTHMAEEISWAALATVTGRGIDADTSQFAMGNLFVQPLWLGWTRTHWDLALGYGFYAPVGQYDTSTVTLPGGATVTAEAADNIGLGFWTNQFQGAVTWYPWAHKATAVSAVLTYEIHSDKEDFDLTPGQNLTLNWGISQFLPLSKEQKLLLEAGVTGYSSWQVSDDSGSDARNPDVHDEVHAVVRLPEPALLW